MFAPIVSAIQDVSDAIIKLQNSKVKERVILLLIRDQTNLSLADIQMVLNAAANLKSKYLK